MQPFRTLTPNLLNRLAGAAFLLLSLICAPQAWAQEKTAPAIPLPGSMATNQTSKGQTIVQFTGLVVAGEKAYGVPGATVSIPRSRRGTTTNYVGYFSLPVLAGDTTIVSALGFRKRKYVVPASPNASHSVIIYMEADTLQLPTVDIVPFPTESLFKEAFLALNLDRRDVDNARRNLDPYDMENMRRTQPMDGKMNYTNAMNQQVRRIEVGGSAYVPQLSLLDPFAWARFIESVKRGDLKKKDRKDKEE